MHRKSKAVVTPVCRECRRAIWVAATRKKRAAQKHAHGG